MRITHLIIYKPDGGLIEFEKGEDVFGEGVIANIFLTSEKEIPIHPRIIYERQKNKDKPVEWNFIGFPYSYSVSK